MLAALAAMASPQPSAGTRVAASAAQAGRAQTYTAHYVGHFDFTSTFTPSAYRLTQTIDWDQYVTVVVRDGKVVSQSSGMTVSGRLDLMRMNGMTREIALCSYSALAGAAPQTLRVTISGDISADGQPPLRGYVHTSGSGTGSLATMCRDLAGSGLAGSGSGDYLPVSNGSSGGTVSLIEPPGSRRRFFDAYTVAAGAAPARLPANDSDIDNRPSFGNAEESFTRNISSAIRIERGAVVSPLSLPTPRIPGDQKMRAREDLRLVFRDLISKDCLPAPEKTAVVWRAVDSVGSGAAVIVAELLGPDLPVCEYLIARAVHDATILDDPPDPRTSALAAPRVARPGDSLRLPRCRSSLDARAQRLCAALRPAVRRWVTAVATVTAITKAMLTTVNRQSTALAAGDATNAARQRRHAADLQRMLVAARAAQRAAGAQVARPIRAAGVRGRLTRAQSARAIGYVLDRMARRGVPASTVRAIAGDALEPRPVDLLEQLTR